jgi:phosphate transport system permease protein
MNYFTWRKIKNIFFIGLIYLAGFLCLLPLFLIIQFIFSKGATSLNLDFFTQLPKPVGEMGGGMYHAIIGTIYLVGLGSIISIPIGLVCGIYLSEYGSGKLANMLRFSTDLLTGVPSIIIGIFAYILIVVPLKGFSAMAGSVALALIILPIVIRSTEEILKLIPDHIREAGLALGLPRWKVIFFVVVKGSVPGLITGIMLAISRAAGETAPLLFTAFGNMYTSYHIGQPMASLPVQIYNYAISPFEDWQRQAWAGAFTLIILVLGLNLTARTIVNRHNIYKLLAKLKK